MPEPVLVDLAAAAAYAQVRPSTIRTWARRYRWPRHGSARRRLYDLADVTPAARRHAERLGRA